MNIHQHERASNQKPAVLFIHGFCEDHQVWDEIAASLAENYTVVTLDLPGFGKSAPFDKQPRIDDYAQAIAEELKLRNIQEYIVIGHSLGGYIGLSMLEQFANQVKGLMLFHSTAYADSEEKKGNRTKTAEFLQKNGSEKWLHGLFDGLFSPKYKDAYQLQKQTLLDRAKQAEVRGIIQATLAMRDRPDRRHLLKSANIPIGFVIGKEDQAVPLEASLSHLSLPKNAQAFIWEGVGHLGMIEAPEKAKLAVEQFVGYCCG